MRASIDELLEQARERAKQYLVALFAASPLHEVLGTKLIPFGTIPVGEQGNRYELHVFPAITHHMPLRGKPSVDLVFAVFSPTGALRELRDEEEENGKPGVPNRACTQMAYDFNASSPDVQNVIARVIDWFQKTWRESTFEHLVTLTNTDLNLVFAFVSPKSLQQLAEDLEHD